MSLIPFIITLVALTTTTLPADSAWNAYLSGDFDRVEQIVFVATKDTTLSENELARLYLALGCADAFRKRDAAAIAGFEMALTLDPKIALTESDLPPPVWKLYAPVRARIPSSERTVSLIPRDTVKTGVFPKTIIKVDTVWSYTPVAHNAGTVTRSLLFPGWGHLSEGDTRGWLYLATETVLVAGWITSGLQERQARDNYLEARNPEDISGRYDRYNTLMKVRQGFMYLSIAAYLAGQWDFFTSPPPVTFDPFNGKVTVGIKL